MGVHREARRNAVIAYQGVFGIAPTTDEAQPLEGVGWIETRYGLAWGKGGKLSFNIGAIQGGRPPCNPETSFDYVDTSPLPDGTSRAYHACFRKYKDAASGWRDLVLEAYVHHGRQVVLDAARAGDLYGVSRGLRLTGYYEGFGKTEDERISHHFTALRAAVIRQARELGESLPGGEPLPPRTLRLRSPRMTGEDVKLAQAAVGADPDGVFGPLTKKLVRAWQSAHPGLEADGIVGPHTWQLMGIAA